MDDDQDDVTVDQVLVLQALTGRYRRVIEELEQTNAILEALSITRKAEIDSLRSQLATDTRSQGTTP